MEVLALGSMRGHLLILFIKRVNILHVLFMNLVYEVQPIPVAVILIRGIFYGFNMEYPLFLSIGFCKICFTLISGLSAVAMVYSGPENVDMLMAAIVLGLLAPVLSFGIASGAGIGAELVNDAIAEDTGVTENIGGFGVGAIGFTGFFGGAVWL
jgi:hypothetical protein